MFVNTYYTCCCYRDLFNAAFMSVWTELTEDLQNDLTSSLFEALKHSNHADVIQTILNLAEFMDHSEKVFSFFKTACKYTCF